MTGSLTPITLTAASWLLTYALHSSVLLGLAWLVARALRGRRFALEELVWRAAVLGGLLTASLQIGLGVGAGTFDLATVARPATTTPAVTASPATPDTAPVAADQTAPPAAAASATGIGTLWPWALLAPWLVGAALGIARLGRAAGDLRKLLADRLPVSAGPLAAALRHLLQLLPEPPGVALSSSQALPLPVALGVRHPEICVPERALAELPPPQQEGLCAHELAHLLRRDPAWSLLLAVIEGVLFFQPLNRIARVRLAELAEFRCDDWAARSTGRRHDLARCLATVAEWGYVGARCPLPAASLMGSSRLAQRVRRLVSGTGADDGIGRPRGAAAGASALLVGLALVLPGVGSARAMAQTTPAGNPGDRSSIEQPRPATTVPAVAAAPAPAPAPVPVAAPARSVQERQQPKPHHSGKVKPISDDEATAVHAEMARVQAEIDRLSAQIEKRAQHLAQAQLPDQEELQRIEAQQQKHEELARQLEQELQRMKLPDIDTSDLDAEIDRLATQLERAHREHASAAEQEKIRKELEKTSQELASRLRPSKEAMHEMQEKARAIAEAMKPTQEQVRRYAEQARKMAEQMRPQQQELEKLQQQLLKHTERLRELARRLATRHGVFESGEPADAPLPPAPPLAPVSGEHLPVPAPPASPAAPSEQVARPAPPAPPQPVPTPKPAQPK